MARVAPQVSFGSGTQPPAPLASAILNASHQYGVPADLLAGIWREESGATYPNPAVNSSGYGGLFGTRNWNAPTQEQANTAASVLATGLQLSGGNVSQALSYYNSGKLSGGYTSVPGMVSGGTVQTPQSGAAPTSIYQAPPRPSGNSGFDSAVSGVEGAVTGFVENLPVVGGVIRGAKDATDAIKVVAWLFSPKHWVQVFEILVGVGLLAAGFVWLGKGGDSSPPVPIPFLGKSPAGRAAGAATKAAPEALAAA